MLFSLLARMIPLGVAQALVVASHPGPFAVAMGVKTLTDQGRADPFNATEKRRVLLSVFWPVTGPFNCSSQDIIPYMPPDTSASYAPLAESAGLPGNLFESFQLEFCKPSLQSTGCKVRKGKVPRFPLVLFSPGLGESRLLYSVTAKSIAAQGYIVATIDHPYDAEVVEFPDGSVVRRNWSAGMEQRLTEVIKPPFLRWRFWQPHSVNNVPRSARQISPSSSPTSPPPAAYSQTTQHSPQPKSTRTASLQWATR
jgi:hypothetical protein